MEKMIQSTLAYAKITNQGDIMEPVNCEALITKILAYLHAPIKEFNVTVSHDTLPTITGDSLKFSQVFQNLISNALKFRNKQNPKIHIGVTPNKLGYTFFVRDNGIGFNMEFKGRLFKLFGRLNKPEDYPGTGIGLAICKKIVEDYGGKIWVESQPGKGTTFFFNILQQKGINKG
jgi:light-regulated signal transduction histidine kinase (bacteriophytochrome)